MIVDGWVKMSITISVIGLKTDAVEIDRHGHVAITDPDQFFMDWDDEWNVGNGELLGASDMSVDLDGMECSDLDEMENE